MCSVAIVIVGVGFQNPAQDVDLSDGTLTKSTEMTDPDSSPFANGDVIVCHGGAGLFDNLAS
jgi:hypothetical protein